MYNPHKTVSANSRGIIVSFRDINKHKFMAYDNQYVNDLQLKGRSRYQQIEPPVFNFKQQQIYSEAVYGLNIFTKEDLQKMPATKKSAILNHFNKVQRFLNAWKQEIVSIKVDSFLLKLFPRSSVIKHMVEIKGSDDTLKDKHSFKELGISKKMIASKLIEAKLLPKEFFKLT